jgi:hypothetical protein
VVTKPLVYKPSRVAPRGTLLNFGPGNKITSLIVERYSTCLVFFAFTFVDLALFLPRGR